MSLRDIICVQDCHCTRGTTGTIAYEESSRGWQGRCRHLLHFADGDGPHGGNVEKATIDAQGRHKDSNAEF